MSKYINVSLYELSNYRTSNSSRFRCVVSKVGYSYFGLCTWNKFLAFSFRNNSTGEQKYYYHWGFPIKSQWKSSWGSPSYNLYSGKYTNCGVGNLKGYMGNSYTWEETVYINKGNSRQGSVEISAGAVAGSSINSNFGTTMPTIRLYTTETPRVSGVKLICSVDPSDTINKRYIRISGAMTNYDNFYTAYLYRNGTFITTFTNNSFDYNIEIDKYAEKSTEKFTLKVFGKDNVLYDTKETSCVIEPAGVGLTVKESEQVKEIISASLKNVNTKEVPEIWIKVDDKIYRTVK